MPKHHTALQSLPPNGAPTGARTFLFASAPRTPPGQRKEPSQPATTPCAKATNCDIEPQPAGRKLPVKESICALVKAGVRQNSSAALSARVLRQFGVHGAGCANPTFSLTWLKPCVSSTGAGEANSASLILINTWLQPGVSSLGAGATVLTVFS